MTCAHARTYLLRRQIQRLFVLVTVFGERLRASLKGGTRLDSMGAGRPYLMLYRSGQRE